MTKTTSTNGLTPSNVDESNDLATSESPRPTIKRIKLLVMKSPTLLGLPREVRLLIWSFLFLHSEILIGAQLHNYARRYLRPYSSSLNYRFSFLCKNGLALRVLSVCKALRHEMLDVLSEQKINITLPKVNCDVRIRNMPLFWKSSVKSITCADEAAIIGYSGSFKNLKAVYLPSLIHHFEKHQVPTTIQQVLNQVAVDIQSDIWQIHSFRRKWDVAYQLLRQQNVAVLKRVGYLDYNAVRSRG